MRPTRAMNQPTPMPSASPIASPPPSPSHRHHADARVCDRDGEPRLRPGAHRAIHGEAGVPIPDRHRLPRRLTPKPSELPGAHLWQHWGIADDGYHRLPAGGSAPSSQLRGSGGGPTWKACQRVPEQPLSLRAEAQPFRVLRKRCPKQVVPFTRFATDMRARSHAWCGSLRAYATTP